MSTAENNFVIEVKDVYKSFKTVNAVKGVSFNIRKGEFAALLGPNGAGKTTIVEMIEGIQFPDKGEISVLNKHWKGNEDELHQSIGLSLQETRFIDKLNVEETLQLFASFYPTGKADRKRINHIIEITGLQEKRKAYTVNLSGGQRQKLALGISLLNNPKVLLLDEPTTGLDPNARREIWNILLDLKSELDTSLVLTTHYMEEAEQLCDYIIIIDHGKIIMEGSRNDLLTMNDEIVIEFSLNQTSAGSDELFKSFKGTDGIRNITFSPAENKGTLVIKDLEGELPGFLNYLKDRNITLKNFVSRRKTLDDIFTTFTGRHLDEQDS